MNKSFHPLVLFVSITTGLPDTENCVITFPWLSNTNWVQPPVPQK